MQYLRRNFLPILVGVSATLVAIAAVVVIVDRVRHAAVPERVVRLGALRIDLDELVDTFEGLDLDDLDRLREFMRSFDLAELLPSIEELREQLGAVRVGGGPVLGVTVEAGDGAVVVRAVQPGTPAARAGIEAGDEIVSVDGIRVDGIDELREVLDAIEPGEDYELVVRRDGDRMTLEVERQAFVAAGVGDRLRDFFRGPLDQPSPRVLPRDGRELPEARRPFAAPETPAGPRLGVTAVETPDGVRVARIEPRGAGPQAGLQPGDVITRIEGRRVASIEQLRERLLDFEPGDAVSVTVLRDGEREVLRVRLSGPAERVTRPGRAPSGIDGLDGQLERLFRDAGQLHPGGRRQFMERLTDLIERFAGSFESGAAQRPELRPAGAPAPELRPANGVPDGAALERLADLVAERLAARGVLGASAPGSTPAPQASAAPPAELTAYFGRVVAIDAGSVTLTGTLGAVTLQLTAGTARVGFKQAAAGDLVTAVVLGDVVQMLIVVG